jgi:hypothetical protein
MYGYVLMAMVMAHPYAAGVAGEFEQDKEQERPPKPRKPPRGGMTMRVPKAAVARRVRPAAA